MHKLILSAICVLFVCSMLFSQGLNSWSSRETIIISEQSGTTLTDYQVKVVVTYLSGMNNDFSDVRFTDSDGTTLLSHWLEYSQNSVSATFWVKMPLINAFAQQTVFMFYGNPTATSASDGPSTFIFFDDLSNLNNWNSYGGGVIISDNTTFPGSTVLRKQGPCDPAGGWKPLGTSVSSFRLICRESRINGNSCRWNRYGLENNLFNGYSLRRKASVTSSGEFGFERRTGGSANNVRQTVLNQAQGNFYRTEMVKDCNTGFVQVSLSDDSGNLRGRHAASDNTYCSFDRFVLRGGVDYFFDNISVAKFIQAEPIVSFQNQIIILPLELLNFDAAFSEDGNILKWELSQVADVSSFQLEYSTDAIDFENLQNVPVSGLSYEFVDKNHYSSDVVYYRLRAEMSDGSVEYSEIEAVEMPLKNQGVTLAPNPTSGKMKVIFSTEKKVILHLMVMDVSGRLAYEKKSVSNAGEQVIELDLYGLSAGLYHLVVSDGVSNRIRRFIKQ